MNTEKLRERILDTIKSFGKKRIRRRQLYNLIGDKNIGYEEFKGVLTELENAGAVVRMKGRRFALPGDTGLFTGVFTRHANGGGYVRTGDGASFYVRPRDTGDALTGDTVQAKMSGRRRPGFSPTAKVTAILERAEREVIGIYTTVGNTALIIPQSSDFVGNILVTNSDCVDAEEGVLVAAKVNDSGGGYSRPTCRVVEVLGDPDAPGVDVLALARRHGLPVTFPEEVLAEAGRMPADLSAEVIGKRRDIRELVTFTIDPEDAKDFDDAVSVERTADGGFRLGVHIADVAHYVREDSIVDREARSRAMSCYLVDRVLPMLPERLSNNLCSLRPDEDRLTKSVFAVVDRSGSVVSGEIADTVIHSRQRLTYRQVQAFLDGKESDGADAVDTEVGASLRLFSDLADALLKRREERFALDFENPEAKVVLDGDGRPVDIVKYRQVKAHRMIEEAMILANRITAEALAKAGARFLYRIHEDPDTEKLESFAEVARSLGHRFHPSGAGDRRHIAAFLEELRGKKYERTLNLLLLRAMKRARYSPKNMGHYGLALDVYAHFTSPIRRYPDLVVQRQLDSFVLGNGGDGHDMDFYTSLGESISEREMVNAAAERDSVKMKVAEFMKSHLGEEFDGTISGVIPLGFFVELDRYFVEGLVHVSSLTDDYYEIERSGVALVGRSKGTRYVLGDRVRVVVAAANKERRQVDFILVDSLKKKKRKR